MLGTFSTIMKHSTLLSIILSFVTITVPAQTTRYVNLNATGANNGISPANAFRNLDDAIAAAASGDIIMVTQGTYYPTKPLTGSADYDKSFYITKSITLEGGYTADFSDRDIVNNQTILNGDVGIQGDPSDNSCHVLVWRTSDGMEGKINGFIIRNGTNNGRAGTAVVNKTYGAGIHQASGNLIISNSIISNNKSSSYGGGIYSTGAPLTLENVTVSNNGSGWNGSVYNGATTIYGGGIYANHNLILKGVCKINNNYSTGSGGGIYKANVSGTEINVANADSLFINGNTSGGTGGGIYLALVTDFSNLKYGEIRNNKAKSTGGGIHTAGALFLNNTIISGNRAGWDDVSGKYLETTVNGGGIYTGSALILQGKMQISENTATGSGGGVYVNNTLELKGKIELNKNSGTTGGGLYKGVGAFTATGLDSLIITNNKSTIATGTIGGGGIYTAVALDCSNLKYALIDGNNATLMGGGIHAANILYLKGNINIKNNTCEDRGGGIFANNTLSIAGKLSLENNQATSHGGGIWKNTTGGFFMTDIDTLIFKGNKTLEGNGGGIYISGNQIIEFLQLKDGQIEGNTANGTSGMGGAIYAGAGLTLPNAQIRENSSTNSGGGIYVNGELKTDQSYFYHNSSGIGGAIYKGTTGAMAITKSTFVKNEAKTGGGSIISAINSTLSQNISNCTFSGNTSGSNGGAIYFSGTGGSGSIITFSTFNDNSTTTNSGNAIHYNYINSVKGILNGNIIYGNGTDTGPKSEIFYTDLSNNITANYNIIRDLEFPVSSTNQNIPAGQGNLIFDNNFVSGDVATLHNNGGATPTLLIKNGGLAHDKIPLGDASSYYESTIDQRNINRIVNMVDIGSVELSNTLPCNDRIGNDLVVWYVDASVSPGNSGMGNPASPANSLTDVLNNACLHEGDIIKIAEGTYYSTESDRNNSFLVTKAISIYGGYTSDFSEENRNMVSHPTILDGNSLSYHVIFWNTDANKSGLIDGVTIQKGKADGSSTLGYGGGVFLSSGQLILSNFIVKNNSAADKGGGIYSAAGTTLILKDGLSQYNKAGYKNRNFDKSTSGISTQPLKLEEKSGGFVCAVNNLILEGQLELKNDSSSWNGGSILKSDKGTFVATNLHTLIMESCTAVANAEGTGGNIGGGGIYTMVDLDLSNTKITANNCQAPNNQGGGIFINNKAGRPVVLKVANSTFTNCIAGMDGGALESYGTTSSNIFVTNSTFTGCYAGRYGGALGIGNALTLIGKIVIDRSNSGVNGAGISQWNGSKDLAVPFDASQLDTLIITNCNVILAPAYTTGNMGGAAIWVQQNNLDLSNAKYVLIENNYSREHGGGIKLDKSGYTLTLGANVIFRNNRAGYVNGGYSGAFSGGAIYLPAGNNNHISIKGEAIFENNSANSNGGAIYAPSALSIPKAIFTGNRSVNGNGGAIYKAAPGKMDISKTTFANDTAKAGGAIYTEVASKANENSISNCTFTQNRASAGNGGAINSSTGAADLCLSIQMSSFNGNTASSNTGHAIFYNNASGEILNGNIICGNGTTGSEISSIAGISANYNISRTSLSGVGNIQSNMVDSIFESVDGNIATLANNGGFTKTLMIKTGGLAQNLIPDSVFNGWTGLDEMDQRDSIRFADCEIDAGSVEKKSQVNDIPSYTLKPIQSICTNAWINADSLIASTINIKDTLYYNDQNYTQLLQMPVQGKNRIYVKFISLINCEVYDTIKINLIPTPVAKIRKNTTEFCSGNPVKLVVDTTYVSAIQWHSDYAGFINANGLNSDTLIYNPPALAKDTTFNVYVTAQGVGPCSLTSDTLSMTLKGRPTATIKDLVSSYTCAGEEMNFSVVTTNSTYIEWIGGEGIITPARKSAQLSYAYDSIPHIYVPAYSERGKEVELILKSAGGTCGYLYDTLRITVFPLLTDLGLTLVDQPKGPQTTCQDTIYELKIKAPEAGILKNIRIKLIDDKLTNIVPVAGKYKYKQDTWTPLTNPEGDSHTWAIPEDLASHDSLYVRVAVQAGCEFTSGDNFKFELSANNSCDERLPEKQVTTNKFYLRSDPSLSSTYTFQNNTKPTLVNSQNGDTIYHRIRLDISGTQATDSTRESIVSFIPEGFSIVPGSLHYIHNANGTAKYKPIDGGFEVHKPIPSGLQNDSVIYELKLYAGNAKCGDYDVRTQVYYAYEATCHQTTCSASAIKAEYSDTVNIRRYEFSIDPTAGNDLGGETRLGKWSGNIKLNAINGFFATDSLKVNFYVDETGNSNIPDTSAIPVKTVYVKTDQDIQPGTSFIYRFKDIPASSGHQLIAYSNDKLLCSPLLIPITILLGPDTICQNKTYQYVLPENMSNYSIDAISGATRVPITNIQDYSSQNVAQIKFTSGSGEKEIKGTYIRSIGDQSMQAAKTTFHTYLNPAASIEELKTENDRTTFCTPGVVKVYAKNVKNITSQQWTAPDNIGALSGTAGDTLIYTLYPRVPADTMIWIKYNATSLSGCDNLEDSIHIKIYQTLSQPLPEFRDSSVCYNYNLTIKQAHAQGGGISNPDNYQYQWQYRTVTSMWKDAPDAFGTKSTDQDYFTSALTETTWFRRIVTSICTPDTGAVVKVKVFPEITFMEGSLSVTNSACPVKETTISFEAKGGQEPYFYKLAGDDKYTPIKPYSTRGGNIHSFRITEAFDPGSYTLFFTDSIGCNVFEEDFIIEENLMLSLEPTTDPLFVKELPSGNGTGTDWNNAFDGRLLGWYLHTKISENQPIYIAEGSYYPYYDSCDDTDKSREYTFELNKSGISITGGYDKNSENKDLNSYNPKKYITRLSGAIKTPDNTDNSYHVLAIEEDVTASIQGVVISDGYAHENSAPSGDIRQNGGGILNKGGKTTEDNIGDFVSVSETVLENNAGDYGAAIYCFGNSLTEIDSVTVKNNISLINTGGSIFAGGDFNIFNSTINNNNDGIVIQGGDIDIINSTIANNTRGIYAWNTDKNIDLTITGATITGGEKGVIIDCTAGNKTMILKFNSNLVVGNNTNLEFSGTRDYATGYFRYSIVGNKKYITSIDDFKTLSREVELENLDDNGGWGQTQALISPCDNPAVGAGDPALLFDEWTETDQRGISRNQIPSTGAYELTNLPAKSTTWTGEAEIDKTNWNDPKNWDNGVPTSCTNVIIPGYIEGIFYPVIQETDEAVCDTIWLNMGGEVSKTAYLNYNAAKVDMSIPINAYHMIAPPLGSMYSGDYFIESTFDPAINKGMPRQNPAVWGKLYQTTNPEKQIAAKSGTWSRYFNTLDYPLAPGMGFCIWIDEGETNPNADFTIYFPKDSVRYYYYNENTGARGSLSGPMDRAYKDRFIYEQISNYNQTTGEFNIKVTSDVEGNNMFSTAIVGNPFMSHLDFTKFYQANSDKIEPTYHLWSGNSFETFTTFGDTKYPLSEEENNAIAPMQAFIVTKKNTSQAIGTLKFTPDMSVNLPGYRLKALHQEPCLLKLSLNRDGYRHSGILLQYKEGETNRFRKDKDAWTMFANNMAGSAILYALVDGKATSIHTFGDISERIPLGIATTKKGMLTITFDEIENFDPGLSLYLEDSSNGRLIDMRQEDSSYSFMNSTGDIQNRFFVIIEKQTPTSIDNKNMDSSIQIYINNEQIHILTNDNDLIEIVEFYNLQGNLIFAEKDIQKQYYSKNAYKEYPVLIVKVKTSKTTKVEKVSKN